MKPMDFRRNWNRPPITTQPNVRKPFVCVWAQKVCNRLNRQRCHNCCNGPPQIIQTRPHWCTKMKTTNGKRLRTANIANKCCTRPRHSSNWAWNRTIPLQFWHSIHPNGSIRNWLRFMLGKSCDLAMSVWNIFYSFRMVLQWFSCRSVYDKFTGSGFPCAEQFECKHCCGRRYQANGQNQRNQTSFAEFEGGHPIVRTVRTLCETWRWLLSGKRESASINFFPWNNFILFSQWSDIQAFELDDFDAELEKRINNIYANECCVLVYTVSRTPNSLPFKSTHTFPLSSVLSMNSPEPLVIQKVSC